MSLLLKTERENKISKWRTGDLNSLFLPWEGSVLAARRVRHICYPYHTQPAGDNSLHCPSLVSASTLSWWGIKHLYKCDNNCSLSRIWFLKNSNRICIVPSRMHPTIVEWGYALTILKPTNCFRLTLKTQECVIVLLLGCEHSALLSTIAVAGVGPAVFWVWTRCVNRFTPLR